MKVVKITEGEHKGRAAIYHKSDDEHDEVFLELVNPKPGEKKIIKVLKKSFKIINTLSVIINFLINLIDKK